MNKLTTYLLAILLLISAKDTIAINYQSAGAGPADWNNSSSWTPTGIPTQNDNVTILTGHTITISSQNNKCKDLTVDGTLSYVANVAMVVHGNYTLNGTESGTGKLQFYPPGTLVTATGTTSITLLYGFFSDRTVTAGSTLNKINAVTQIGSNITVTNLGTFIIGSFTSTSTSTFINGATGVLTTRSVNFMTTLGSFDASTVGNTVNLIFTNGNIPTPISGFYNLNLVGNGGSTGTKKLIANIVVNNNLTINSTNILNTNDFDLTVKGNFSNSGTFIGSTNNAVIFNGTDPQLISTTGTLKFTNLVIDNLSGVSLQSGSFSLSDVFTINSGIFDTGGRPFTMLSTATKTARIAPVAGDILGNFTIQRFISARDTTWSCLASPVQSTTIQDWDNELFMYLTTDVAQATVFTYDETIADYNPVSTATEPVSAMQGFEIYLTADLSLNNISNITLNSIGNPTYGDLTKFLDYTSGTGYEGQNLVGNPYASSISWTDVYNASSDIENYADVFDNVVGNYSNVNLGDEIGLGQGFWVYAQNTSGFLQILESAKTTSTNSSLRLNKQMIPTLTIASAEGSHTFAHKLEFISNSNFSNGKDTEDRPYRISPNKKAPKITAVIDGKDYVRNSFSADNKNYSLPLSVKVGISGKYEIKAENIDIISTDYSCVVLEDTKLNQFIDLNARPNYIFFASVSDATDRFTLHLSKEGACKSSIGSSIASSIENQVQILPTSNGNSIAFNFEETLNTTVTVTNTLGQSIVEGFSVQANTQTIELGIPSDFSGMYIIKIENEKGVVTKKFVKK